MKMHLVRLVNLGLMRTWCGMRGSPAIAENEYLNKRGKHMKATDADRLADCQTCHRYYSAWHRRQS